MSPLLYPESAWPARFGRFVRTLQVVAIAGAVGAIAGGVSMLAVMDSGPPNKPIIVDAASANGATAGRAAKVVGDAHGSPQSPAAPAAASPVPAAPPGLGTPQPAAAPPASGTPQPSQFAAAAAPPAAAAPQMTAPAGAPAPAASGLYNRVAPAEHSVHARSARLRARENRRSRSMASRYARERDRRSYDAYGLSQPYGPSERGAAERDVEAGAVPRSNYPYYYASPRSSYWGNSAGNSSGNSPWGGGPRFGGDWGN
jgi:translation initiation factor IF-2